MKSQFNEMILLAETKGKKGGGINAILKFIADVRDFQDKLEAAIEAQDMAEYKSKLEAFNGDLNKMYDVLFEIAKSGVKDMRKQEGVEIEEDVENSEKVEETPSSKTVKPPVMLNVPSIPKI